ADYGRHKPAGMGNIRKAELSARTGALDRRCSSMLQGRWLACQGSHPAPTLTHSAAAAILKCRLLVATQLHYEPAKETLAPSLHHHSSRGRRSRSHCRHHACLSNENSAFRPPKDRLCGVDRSVCG